MNPEIVRAALGILSVYVVLGAVAAALLLVRGLRAIDPGVGGTSLFFRALITPGLVALWPIMLLKWRRAGIAGAPRPPRPFEPVTPLRLRAAHATAIKLLVLLLPPLMALAILTRPPVPAAASAARLNPPAPSGPRTAAGYIDPIHAGATIVGSGELAVLELHLDVDLPAPSLLLYWSAKSGAKAGSPDASFLGALWGPGVRRYELPTDAADGSGQYIVYSLGHAKEFARFTLMVRR